MSFDISSHIKPEINLGDTITDLNVLCELLNRTVSTETITITLPLFQTCTDSKHNVALKFTDDFAFLLSHLSNISLDTDLLSMLFQNVDASVDENTGEFVDIKTRNLVVPYRCDIPDNIRYYTVHDIRVKDIWENFVAINETDFDFENIIKFYICCAAFYKFCNMTHFKTVNVGYGFYYYEYNSVIKNSWNEIYDFLKNILKYPSVLATIKDGSMVQMIIGYYNNNICTDGRIKRKLIDSLYDADISIYDFTTEFLKIIEE